MLTFRIMDKLFSLRRELFIGDKIVIVGVEGDDVFPLYCDTLIGFAFVRSMNCASANTDNESVSMIVSANAFLFIYNHLLRFLK